MKKSIKKSRNNGLNLDSQRRMKVEVQYLTNRVTHLANEVLRLKCVVDEIKGMEQLTKSMNDLATGMLENSQEQLNIANLMIKKAV